MKASVREGGTLSRFTAGNIYYPLCIVKEKKHHMHQDIHFILFTFPEFVYNTNIFSRPGKKFFFLSVIQAIEPQDNPALSTTQHNQTGI